MQPNTKALRTPALAAALLAALLVAPAQAHEPTLGVVPDSVDATLPPGGDLAVAKTVHTPVVPPRPDIIFLADTTGSMGGAIANVKANVQSVIDEVRGEQETAMFGVANYKDFDADDTDAGCTPTTYGAPFSLDQALTATDADVQDAVDSWSAIGGCDEAEAQLNALYELATSPSVGFRPDSTRIVAWFGDAPGHDPSNGHGIGQVIDELVQSEVRVVAVKHVTPGNSGLDSAGQAGQITAQTGGVLLDAGDDVAQAILDGIHAIEVTVSPQVGACDSHLSLGFAPASVLLQSGEDAAFSESIQVAADAPQGTTLHCTVHWLIDGNVVKLADGATDDPRFVQQVSIAVSDVTPPESSCTQAGNPSGNVPKAGAGSGSSGQNPDGFYRIGATDNVDDAPAVYVVDLGSGTVFGPFDPGTVVKYTQAKGATPSQQPMAGNVGWHVTGTGDMGVFAVDDSGNVSGTVTCLVPQPPK